MLITLLKARGRLKGFFLLDCGSQTLQITLSSDDFTIYPQRILRPFPLLTTSWNCEHFLPNIFGWIYRKQQTLISIHCTVSK